MILVDTNIWIDFFHGRSAVTHLSDLLLDQQVATHPWIIAELSLGNLGRKRKSIVADLNQLPIYLEIPTNEIIDFVDHKSLHAKGLSFIDIGLLMTAIVENAHLWSADKRLQKIAASFGCHYEC